MTQSDGRADSNAFEELTAAEAAVLTGQGGSAHALKLAMLELIARGLMELTVVERRGRLGRRYRETLLIVAPGATEPVNAVLAQPWRAVKETEEEVQPDGSTGRRLADVAQRAVSEWKDSGGFADAVVVESLVRRGLMARSKKKWLGLLHRPVTKRTPNGDAFAARITSELDQLRKLPQAVRDDPGAAAQHAGAVSPVIILLGAGGPDRRKLDEAFRRIQDSPGDDGMPMAWYWGLGTGGDSAEERASRTFEELSSTFDSLDAGVDSGSGGWDGDDGGDGGGDGGGD